jgi:hypothetical protein
LTTLSVAFFAALASAHAHHPQHFHHRRQYNTTSAAGGELTTLTVLATHIHTVTSCAATVTDCPARTSPVVVTDVIALTTVRRPSYILGRNIDLTVFLDCLPSRRSRICQLGCPRFIFRNCDQHSCRWTYNSISTPWNWKQRASSYSCTFRWRIWRRRIFCCAHLHTRIRDKHHRRYHHD